jgi:predicted enzyme related to lactoylglutathione lyase
MPSSPFERVVPILRVEDLRRSLDFYINVLGFKKDWGGDAAFPAMASVSRGGGSVMLCHRGQGNPGTWVWFGVEDAALLHEEYIASGAKVVLPPTNFSWALEIRVQDPDGHVLRSAPSRGRTCRSKTRGSLRRRRLPPRTWSLTSSTS